MSWVPEKRFEYGWMDTLAMKILKCGNIPGHVAFIMDGNRRFARQKNLEKIEGHSQGFEKLAEALQWCHDLGIKEVTVYAFR
jgi:ditrans,polycis-polyprenyl diphosphate synthase